MTRRSLMFVCLAVAVLLTLAAAAQVTREEFDALAKKVRQLESRCVMVDIQNKRQDEEIARLRAVRPAAGQQAQPQAQPQAAAKALTGNDLLAWKLARAAAEEKHQALLRVPTVRGTGGSLERGGAGAYAVIANAQRREAARQAAGKFDPGKPTSDQLERTEAGDYVCTFAARSFRTGALKRLYRVRVADYGTELRIEGVELVQ